MSEIQNWPVHLSKEGWTTGGIGRRKEDTFYMVIPAADRDEAQRKAELILVSQQEQ
jgi:hypothetical protein